ncbi:MAG: O-antigen ligase family protein [Pseudomonadota bacterium]
MAERSRSGGGIQGGVAWIVLIAVLLAAVGLGGNREQVWVPLAAVLLLAFAIQSLLGLRASGAGLAFRKGIVPLLLFLGVLVWAATQAWPDLIAGWAHPVWSAVDAPASISAAPQETRQGLLRLAAYGAAFWVAVRAAEHTVRVSRLVDAIAVFGTLLAAYGLAAWGTGQNPVTGESAYPGYVTSTFVNRNAYALYAAFGCMACITAIAMRLPDQASEGLARSVAKREMIEILTRTAWVFTLGALVCAVAMLLTGSRAGAVCGMAGIALVLTSMVRRHLGIGWAIGVLVLLVVVPGALAPVLTERLGGLDPWADQRFQVYALVIEGLSDRPWLGHGLGAFQDTFRAYMVDGMGTQEWDLAHSSYLENAWELGIAGAVALTLVPVVILFGIMAGLGRRRRMRPVLIFGLGAGLAAGFHAAVDFSMQMPATAALFTVILGLAWGLAIRPVARGMDVLDD